ncbi:MAG: hypothetical protein ABIH69_05010 [bacterium]|nr:hypothetical protein [Candidatus Margulisiibacteriota bacterium]
MSSRIGTLLKRIFKTPSRPKANEAATRQRERTSSQSCLVSDRAPLKRSEITPVDQLTETDQSLVINGFGIRSESELLTLLRMGKKILLYRGFSSEYLPEIGQRWVTPFGGPKNNIQDKPYVGRLIAQVGEKEFPACPGRYKSVFAAPKPWEAAKFGEVYEIEISLISDGREITPVRWLNRAAFDEIVSVCAGKESYDGLPNEDHLMYARDYLRSSGHPDGASDIIINPKHVEIRVKRRYVSVAIDLARKFAEKLEVSNAIADYEELLEVLETEKDGFPEGVSPELIRSESLKFYIRGKIRTLSCYGRDLIQEGLAEIRTILAENNLYPNKNDSEYEYILSELARLEKDINQSS